MEPMDVNNEVYNELNNYVVMDKKEIKKADTKQNIAGIEDYYY